MSLYMHRTAGSGPEDTLALRRVVDNYGTTLRGLQIHYQVDPHGIDMSTTAA
jgi:hypothetical protein